MNVWWNKSYIFLPAAICPSISFHNTFPHLVSLNLIFWYFSIQIPNQLARLLAPFHESMYFLTPGYFSSFMKYMTKYTTWSATHWGNFLSSVYFKAFLDCGCNIATIYFQLIILYQAGIFINQVHTFSSALGGLMGSLHMTLAAWWGKDTGSTRVDHLGACISYSCSL